MVSIALLEATSIDNWKHPEIPVNFLIWLEDISSYLRNCSLDIGPISIKELHFKFNV